MTETTIGDTAVRIIGIGQLRGDTCNYIDQVAAGAEFDIVRRGRPVARLQRFERPCGQYTIAVPLAVLRTSASRLMDRVAAGETITIEHRGRVVATLRPHLRETATSASGCREYPGHGADPRGTARGRRP